MALQFPLTVVLLLLLVACTTVITAAAAQVLTNCSDMCGNFTVPYPFGMKEDCYLRNEFFVNCSYTSTTEPPTAYLMHGNVIVTNINLDDGELQVLSYVARECYNKDGGLTYLFDTWLNLPLPYTISDTKNKFYTVGCDTYAYLQGFRGEIKLTTGCISICGSRDGVDNSSCKGAGCCQTDIPIGLMNQSVTVGSFRNHSDVWTFNPCSYAFIAEQGQFNFSPEGLKNNQNYRLPLVLNWAIGNEIESCPEAQERKDNDFVCNARSRCVNRNITGSVGYLCECLPGYEGNPYHPDGCQDVDECKDSNPCKNGQCNNVAPPSNYICLCDEGYKNDPENDKNCIKKESRKLSKIVLLVIISLGATVGFLVLFICVYWRVKKRQFIRLRRKHFKENGGLLLLQQLGSHGNSVDTTKIFTAEELEKATDNYHESTVLGEGGYGTVYKGLLPDNKVVAIKKAKGAAPTQSDQFVNEVIILSKINHKNVVKLLGCGLETHVPLLVYEFITHGTLYEHIHNKRSSLSFELRMKIAVETAEALAHLHFSLFTSVIHRDVKAANILLDDNYTAKVSDFGASRLLPSGQIEIQTLVLGTFGYLDPEYLQSNQLTEKSDVYSFGVVLVELLTSKVAVSENRCLASIFVSSMEEDSLNQVLDHDIVNERNIETVKKVAKLAERCLRLKGEERPTMKEVAKELEEMNITTKHPWGSNANFCEEETEYLLQTLKSDAYVVDVGEGDRSGLTGGASTVYDSMQIEQWPHDGGR